jgi:hypothetical protein
LFSLCAYFSSTVQQAFGHDGLGALAVKGVPGFAEKRQAILPLAYAFGHLPDDVKAKYKKQSQPAYSLATRVW